MNIVDGNCACCGEPTQYTGRLPIICPHCQEMRRQIANGNGAELLMRNDLNSRLFLPDSELMPKPKTIADFM